MASTRGTQSSGGACIEAGHLSRVTLAVRTAQRSSDGEIPAHAKQDHSVLKMASLKRHGHQNSLRRSIKHCNRSNTATDPTSNFTESLRPKIADNATLAQSLRSGSDVLNVSNLNASQSSVDPDLVS